LIKKKDGKEKEGEKERVKKREMGMNQVPNTWFWFNISGK
jgi:hypothetical protein